MKLSGSGQTAANRWMKQYIAEQPGEETAERIPLDADKQHIKELDAKLAEPQRGCLFIKNRLLCLYAIIQP